MSDFVYNDEFATISGTIEGSSQFDPHFVAIETAIASKADKAGPVTHTGTRTIATLVASTAFTSSTAATFSGTFTATGVATANFAALTATGTITASDFAGSADTTHIDGGTW